MRLPGAERHVWHRWVSPPLWVRSLFPEVPPCWRWGEKRPHPSPSSTDQVSQTTLFKPSSLCRGCKRGGLSRSAHLRASLALGWDLNPSILKGPTPCTPVPGTSCPAASRCCVRASSRSADYRASPNLAGTYTPMSLRFPLHMPWLQGSAAPRHPIYGLWLAGTGSLCPWSRYTPFSHSTPGRALLSPSADCASELVTKPGAGSPLPLVREQGSRPSAEKAPQLEIGSLSVLIGGFSLVQIESYAAPACLSPPFVSPQRDPSVPPPPVFLSPT